MAFFLLNGPDLGSRPGICAPHAAAAAKSQARLERACISGGPGWGYFAAALALEHGLGISNNVPDLWS